MSSIPGRATKIKRPYKKNNVKNILRLMFLKILLAFKFNMYSDN